MTPAERLTGSLHFPSVDEKVGTVLRYQAKVVGVRRPEGSGDLLHVTALFEMLSFAPEQRA